MKKGVFAIKTRVFIIHGDTIEKLLQLKKEAKTEYKLRL